MARCSNVLLAAAIVGAGTLLPACQSGRSPYESQSDVTRDPQRASELHARASTVLTDDPVEAERLLRDALAADLYHGPSHNNLGVLLLSQGKLYEAANEFEWARKLMPGHPDPRVNLAMTLERAGKIDQAMAAYDAALDVFPNYLPALQGRTMLQVESGQVDATTHAALAEISLRGDDRWRAWAMRVARSGERSIQPMQQ